MKKIIIFSVIALIAVGVVADTLSILRKDFEDMRRKSIDGAMRPIAGTNIGSFYMADDAYIDGSNR
jgi:hypothetical protein